ncbi:hypothetical protein ISS03_04635, partial [Patescibacteria group bacterium]|nr:hypothetical protein [Patescibacteria group bacterium]
MNKVILIIFSISIFLIPRPTLAYTVCAILESGFSVGTLNEDCAGIGVANSAAIKEEVANNAPRFIGYNLPRGNIGQSYTAYLQAEDPDRNEVAWSINIGGNSCTNNIKCGSIGDTNCQGTWAS